MANDTLALPIYKGLLKDKMILDIEYNTFIKKMKEDQHNLALATNQDLQINVIKVTDLASFIQKKVRSLFSFDTVNSSDDEKTKEKKIALQELFAKTMVETFNLAKTAMNDYFNAEASQIERSRKNNEKALQLQFDQQKAKAQSQAESDALDKQFQAAKDKNDKDAFEKNKKIQKQQALINLAIQLSNIAVVATAPGPANIITAGAAGQIMYAIQAALAYVTYFANIARINSAQYEYGGTLPRRGGIIRGRKHSEGGVKFNYEAEDEEMSIIRTKNAPRNKIFQVTGTLHQMASQINVLGGGVQFSPGAKIKFLEYGGSLGQSLQAPVFVSSSRQQAIESARDYEELRKALNEQSVAIMTLANEQSKKVDRIKVAVDPREITSAQKKIVKQTDIGKL